MAINVLEDFRTKKLFLLFDEDEEAVEPATAEPPMSF
jgi:hypothetical protein